MLDSKLGENLHAILIGVDVYHQGKKVPGKPTYGCLRGAVHDVLCMRRFLRDEMGVSPTQIHSLTASGTAADGPKEPENLRPTYENMVRVFEELAAEIEEGDHVLVHYSGHGGRVPTAFPEEKGADAHDECLVPWDIADPQARYLRDLELRALVSGLASRGAGVTLILDSCHAGGALREGEIDGEKEPRGGHDLDDTTRPPGTVMVDKVGFDAGTTSGDNSRGIGDVFWPSTPDGVVLLAACRPNELAYESTFGSSRNGALTFYGLETLREAESWWSYQHLYEVLVAKIHGRFKRQTPILDGDGNRRLLSQSPGEPALGVGLVGLEIGGKEKALHLAAGSAQGVQPGARFAVFSTSAPGTALHLGDAVVSSVEATTSRATIELLNPDRVPTISDRAMLVDAGPLSLKRRVALSCSPPDDSDFWTASLNRAIRQHGCGLWDPASSPELGSDLEIVLEKEHAVFKEPGGLAIHRVTRDADEAGFCRTLVQRLVHIAKFQAVSELWPKDPFSPTTRRLEAKLRFLGRELDPTRIKDPLKLPAVGDRPVQPGQWVCLCLRNTSKIELNLAVLCLLEDFAVEQMLPGTQEGPFATLGPAETLTLPFKVERTLADKPGQDRLRIFSTEEPCNFRWLELPALGEPLPGELSLRGEGRPAGLEALFEIFEQSGVQERRPVLARSSLSGWTVVDVRLQVA